MRHLTSALLTLAVTLPVAAQDVGKDSARRGAEFLRKAFTKPDGVASEEFKTGAVSLAGLALLEAGVKPDDPAVANVTAYVRKTAVTQTETYHVALAILYLDKLADKTN